MIFLDHAATTPMDGRIAERLLGELAIPSNPSSVHQPGQRARRLLDEAREEMAAMLGLEPRHIIFTSGATESNNAVIRGLVAHIERTRNRPARIALTPLEHACIRETTALLAHHRRVESALVPVSDDGSIRDPVSIREFQPDLVCIMAVQNETGIRLDTSTARTMADEVQSLWLCDVTQAIGTVDPAFWRHADFLSFSSHKIYGPPGVGLLAGPGLDHLDPLITGGPQENEHRAGTQPLALIRAFVHAARLAFDEADTRVRHLACLDALLLERLRVAGVPFSINGQPAHRVPGILSLSFPGFAGADLVIALDARGFAVSSGAACATGVMETSPALTALYPDDPARAAGAVRISPGPGTTEAEIVALAQALTTLLRRH